jgi:hypothetical protein
MVMAGAVGHDGLLSVALKLAGQFADVVMALGDLLPDPPEAAGLVVLEEVLDVVDVLDCFFDGLKMR